MIIDTTKLKEFEEDIRKHEEDILKQMEDVTQQLENLKEQREEVEEILGLSLYLKETTNLEQDSDVLIHVPSKYSDKVINKVFHKVAGEEPSLIVHSSENLCHFQ